MTTRDATLAYSGGGRSGNCACVIPALELASHWVHHAALYPAYGCWKCKLEDKTKDPTCSPVNTRHIHTKQCETNPTPCTGMTVEIHVGAPPIQCESFTVQRIQRKTAIKAEERWKSVCAARGVVARTNKVNKPGSLSGRLGTKR